MSTTYQIDIFEEIKLSSIDTTEKPNNFGRGTEKDPSVHELATSIKQLGLMQPPIVVEPKDKNDTDELYTIVAGYRRIAAWKIAFPEQETIKCLVVSSDTNDITRLILAMSENVMRLNYEPRDIGALLVNLLPHYGNDKLRLAKAFGYQTATQINNWLRLLYVDEKLSETVVGNPYVKEKRVLLLSTLPEKIQVDAALAINDKDGTYDVRKYVSYLKQYPKLSPKQVIKKIDSEPISISVYVKLSSNVNEALGNAMDPQHYNLIKTDMVLRYVTDGLKRDGFLDADEKPINKATE